MLLKVLIVLALSLLVLSGSSVGPARNLQSSNPSNSIGSGTITDPPKPLPTREVKEWKWDSKGPGKEIGQVKAVKKEINVIIVWPKN
jgi:hypothetical protein